MWTCTYCGLWCNQLVEVVVAASMAAAGLDACWSLWFGVPSYFVWVHVVCNIVVFSVDLSLWAQVRLSYHLGCGDYATVIFLLHICWVSSCLVVAVLYVSFYYGGVAVCSFIVVLVSVRSVFPGLVRVRVCSCAAAVVAWWCLILVVTAEIHPCS